MVPYAVAVPAGFVLIWQLIKRWYPWIPNDIAFLSKMIKALRTMAYYRKKDIAVCDRLAEVAKSTPEHPAILYEEEIFSYGQMHKLTNQYAHAFRSLGVQSGHKVGLIMMNEPHYIAIWLGCNRIGAVCSFLNFNLKSKSLLHCIDLSEIKILVAGCDPSILAALKNIENELEDRGITVYFEALAPLVGRSCFCHSVCYYVETITLASSEDIPRSWRGDVKHRDPICYIFTSGTTGLPKAVNVDNSKCFAGAAILGFAEPKPYDVVYTSLPLYHSSGAIIGIVGAIHHGCTVALRKKFSASNFWPDCRKYNVTIVQYIGEILRYVCKQPVTPEDRNHSVRTIVGNGLRPDVWKQFLSRFGAHIHVLEFYAATEGNVGFINLPNKFGCIGTYSPLIRAIGNSPIIKFDVETEELIRDSNGRPIKCPPNEPGLLVGKITNSTRISSYKGKEALTEKKVLRNLFKQGDAFFNTGDLLMYDDEYRLYFCDRVGDTFRWGENVSTNEVSDTIADAGGIKECNVYGVKVPGHDGRAGMVTVVLEAEELDGASLYQHMVDSLPSYARPLFVRVQDELEVTGTFKRRKVNLQNEGFDLTKVGDDKLYFMCSEMKAYVPLNDEMQKKIEDGDLRL
uniref:Very long-chain fatty acid transport protein n=1 Tax=Ciona savignyi TaxID=51511 RepID=H2Z7X6_CIOSA